MRKIIKLCLLSFALLGFKGGNDSYLIKEASGFNPLKIKEAQKVKVRNKPLFLLKGEDVYGKYERGERISIKHLTFSPDSQYHLENVGLLEKLMVAKGVYDEKLEVSIYSDSFGVLGKEERAVTYQIIDSYKVKHFVTVILEFFDPYGPAIYLKGVEPLYGIRNQIYVSSDTYLTGQDIQDQFISYDPYDRDYRGMEESYLEIIKDEYHENDNWKYPGNYEVSVKATDYLGNENTFDLTINVCSLKEDELFLGNHALIVTPSSVIKQEDVLYEIFKKDTPFYKDYHAFEGDLTFDDKPLGHSTLEFSAYKGENKNDIQMMSLNLYVFEPVDDIPSRPKDDEGNPFYEDGIVKVGQKEEIKEKEEEKSIFTQITEAFSNLFDWIHKLFSK